MVVKINNKPVLVTEETKERLGFTPFINIGMYGVICLFVGSLINKVALLFTHSVPFPFLLWVEKVFQWFS